MGFPAGRPCVILTSRVGWPLHSLSPSSAALSRDALKCATKRLHASHDFTIELAIAISTFSVNVRSDPATAAALSYSERLALAAVGRGTSRASNNHAVARFRARRRDCGGGLRARAEP